MKNHNFINAYTEYLAQFDHLREQKLFTNALGIAEECVRLLQMNDQMAELSADYLKAVKLIDKSRFVLRELEINFSELSDVLLSLSEVADNKDTQIINKLSGWLDNIQRIKTHASIGQ